MAHGGFYFAINTRHPTDDNAVLIWHAGAPVSMCHPDEPVRFGHHWILPSPLSGMLHFQLKDGPRTLNNYLWMHVDDWPRWELTLIEGPHIHHCAMSYGQYADALLQACKFVPGLQPVLLGRAGA